MRQIYFPGSWLGTAKATAVTGWHRSRFGCSCCPGRKIASGSGGDGVCMCVYMWIYVFMCLSVYTWVYLCGATKGQHWVLSCHSPPYFGGWGSLTEPSIHRLAGLAGSPAPGILLFLPPIVMTGTCFNAQAFKLRGGLRIRTQVLTLAQKILY